MIQSPLLAQCLGYINGSWTDSDFGAKIAVINPATGEDLADVPNMGAPETTRAIEAAEVALRTEISIEQRSEWLTRIADLLLENKDELARIITQEQGKPLKESGAEVDYAAGFFRFFAGQLHHLKPEPLDGTIHNCRWIVYHRPAGVVGLITPWNFPIGLLAKKLAPAIGAGCSVVAKPARQTPLAAIAFWKLVEDFIPPGKLNLIIGSAGPIGDTLCSHPAVRVVSFTGSTEVGTALIAKTAPHVKRLAMELGGNAPFIVFPDADIAVAADNLIMNKFRCAGQTCVCTNRVLAHRDIAEAFTTAVAERVNKVRVGNGLSPETEVGPLIDRAGFTKVVEHVRDAISRGAKRVVGSNPEPPMSDWGCFFPPTVLTGVTSDMKVFREETFGPVVAIATFTSDDEAVELANSTPFGLAAYVFTDEANRDHIVPRLKFGHVGFNTGTGPTPEAPFGGMKQSGIGREGGEEGLWEYCETQTVAMG